MNRHGCVAPQQSEHQMGDGNNDGDGIVSSFAGVLGQVSAYFGVRRWLPVMKRATD